MDLVLFGIQGSGKGTQAKKLAAEFGYDIFEAGGELRKIAAGGTVLGNAVKSFIDAGNLVPHEIIMAVVRKAVAERKGKKMLFDGVPRDENQMRDFDAIMRDAGRDFRAVQIVVDPEACIARILNRAKIEGRADDAQEETIRKRMRLFTEKTLPVIEAYKAQGKMTEVDGNGGVDNVYDRLKAAMNF